MSENLIGKIEELPTPTTGEKNGKPWKRFVIKVAGKTFSSFDTAVEELKVGDNVEIEYKVEGNFNNILFIDKSEDTPTPIEQVSSSAPLKSSSQTSPNTEASIVSQVILKCVSEMVASGKVEMGSFRPNTRVLVEAYKEIKKKLLQ